MNLDQTSDEYISSSNCTSGYRYCIFQHDPRYSLDHHGLDMHFHYILNI